MRILYTLSKVASRNTHKPALNGVLLRENTAIATDGYIAARTSFDDWSDEDTIVPTNAIKANTKDYPRLIDGDIALMNGDNAIKVEPVKENYVGKEEIDKIFNDAGGDTKIMLSIATLEPLVNLMKAGKIDFINLEIDPEDVQRPIRVTINDNTSDLEVIIMQSKKK